MKVANAHAPVDPAELARLERLLRDLRQLLKDGTPPAENLETAPLLDAWSRTLIPAPGLIGRIEAGRRTVTHPVFAMSAEEGWARTGAGWLRLARHCEAVPPRRR